MKWHFVFVSSERAQVAGFEDEFLRTRRGRLKCWRISSFVASYGPEQSNHVLGRDSSRELELLREGMVGQGRQEPNICFSQLG